MSRCSACVQENCGYRSSCECECHADKKPTHNLPRKTIRWGEFRLLSTTNSKRLPRYVEIAGQRQHWVGIGWVDEGEADGTEVLVVEDDGQPCGWGKATMTPQVRRELRAAEIAQDGMNLSKPLSVDEQEGWKSHRSDNFALSMKRPAQETGWLAREISLTGDLSPAPAYAPPSTPETDPAFMRDEFAPFPADDDVGPPDEGGY